MTQRRHELSAVSNRGVEKPIRPPGSGGRQQRQSYRQLHTRRPVSRAIGAMTCQTERFIGPSSPGDRFRTERVRIGQLRRCARSGQRRLGRPLAGNAHGARGFRPGPGTHPRHVRGFGDQSLVHSNGAGNKDHERNQQDDGNRDQQKVFIYSQPTIPPRRMICPAYSARYSRWLSIRNRHLFHSRREHNLPGSLHLPIIFIIAGNRDAEPVC